MNYVSLLGRLTKDPELKYTSGGKPFCRFSIAVTREFNREEADFINCVAWDKRAENIAEYFRKGKRILVAGRLMTGSYDGKDGQKVYTTDVVVDKFEFIEPSNNSGGQSSNSSSTPTTNTFVSDDSEDIMDDDEFPF